jgi:catechol 2,3-dioxygenase-like lactoylglutathione lyase family enzyme
MLSESRLMGLVPTTDRARARRFYQDVLGLRLVGDDGFALVFEVGCATLRVVDSGPFRPQPFTLVGWQVTDLTPVVAGLVAQGVELARFAELPQDEAGIWTAPSGERVAWFRDPDGNLLSVSSAR